MRRWSVRALSPTSRWSVAKWFPSVRQSFTDVSAHGSVIQQQVLEEFRSTVKNGTQKFEEKRHSCYPRPQPVLPLLSPYQSSVHHHGNNLQHFDLLFAGTATATVQLLTFWKLAKKWFDYERRPFYMLLFWLRIYGQAVTDQSPLNCNQLPNHSLTSPQPVSTDLKPITIRMVNSCQ